MAVLYSVLVKCRRAAASNQTIDLSVADERYMSAEQELSVWVLHLHSFLLPRKAEATLGDTITLAQKGERRPKPR